MDDIREYFAQRQAQVERLLARLETAPIVEIRGVVEAAGASGSMAEGETLWSLNAELEPWRLVGGDLEEAPLILRRHLTADELDSWQEQLPAFAVVAFRARVLVDPDLGPQALVEELIGPVEDPELSARADDLQDPVVFDDPRLGACTLDRSVRWFTAEIEWRGSPVRVHLSTDDPAALPGILRHAHVLLDGAGDWDDRARARAADELLALKNDSWLGDDEGELTAEAFVQRMTPQSIVLDPDGSFGFFYDDGDLFWGHAITVTGTLADGPTDADIAG